MFVLTQITNTESFAFIAALVFKLLSRKVLFINKKDNGANFTGKSLKIINSWNAKFSGYF